MPLSFCVLGSGSSGNCTLLRLDGPEGCRHILIDAGLSPRQTVEQMGELGVGLDMVSDVLITHADHDHFHAGWVDARLPSRITWRAHRRHLGRGALAGLAMCDTVPFADAFSLSPGTAVEPLLLPHDALGSVGYVIDHGGVRLGFATDLGRVSPAFKRHFTNLSALAIESNYDRGMQVESPRPAMLKRRIMGGLGHLSNEQALEAVLTADRAGDLRHVVLLHLSRQCNDSTLVKRLYARQAPHLLSRLTITHQRRSTPMLHVTRAATPLRGEQLALF